MLQHLEELLVEPEQLLQLNLADTAWLNRMLRGSNTCDVYLQLVLHDGSVRFYKQRAIISQAQSFHHPNPLLLSIPAQYYLDNALALSKPEGLFKKLQQFITGLRCYAQEITKLQGVGVRMQCFEWWALGLSVEVWEMHKQSHQ